MADILDFSRARRQRDAAKAVPSEPVHVPPVSARTHPYPPSAPRPRVVPPPTNRAGLMTLTGHFVDTQIHAAIRDVQDGQGGYWVITYPAITKMDTIPYSSPLCGAFIDRARFHAEFESTGGVLGHGIANHLTDLPCTPSDPYARPEIFRRRLDHVEKVLLRGVYTAAAQIPRPVVEQNHVVLHHVGGHYDIIRHDEARLRLHTVEPGTGRLQGWS